MYKLCLIGILTSSIADASGPWANHIAFSATIPLTATRLVTTCVTCHSVSKNLSGGNLPTEAISQSISSKDIPIPWNVSDLGTSPGLGLPVQPTPDPNDPTLKRLHRKRATRQFHHRLLTHPRTLKIPQNVTHRPQNRPNHQRTRTPPSHRPGSPVHHRPANA